MQGAFVRLAQLEGHAREVTSLLSTASNGMVWSSSLDSTILQEKLSLPFERKLLTHSGKDCAITPVRHPPMSRVNRITDERRGSGGR